MKLKKREEVINKMIDLKVSIQEELTNNQEIANIGYYKDFKFKGTQFGINEAYIVKVKDDSVPEKELKPREKDDKDEIYIYQIYDKNNNLVATVDKNGNVKFELEYFEGMDKQYLESLELDEEKFELPDELQKDDLVLTSDELEEKEKDKKLEEVSKVIKSDEIDSYSEMETNQTSMFNKVTNKQELDPNTRVTQTETLADMIPELKVKGITKVGVVYSDHSKGQNGRFSFVGIDKDGKIQKLESLENIQGTTTGQTISSINSADGSLVEKEQVAGMVRINGRNNRNGREEFISVRQGQYGTLEVDYVRSEPSEDKENRYISAPIETHNIKPTTREVREFMDKSKNIDMKDELKKSESELERDNEMQMRNMDDTASNDELGIDDIIVLEDGTETTLRQEAAKDKVSPEKFARKYNEHTGKTPDGKIDDIHDEIEEEFGTPSRGR